MTEQTPSGGQAPRAGAHAGAPDEASAPSRSDLGRRVRARREALGLSREAVAERAGSAPGYLQYLEDHSARPSSGLLLRLAHVLRTSVAELVGGTAELPAGIGRAGHHPELLVLSAAESLSLLGGHGVGRIAVTRQGAPAIAVVNYTVRDRTVAFRTERGGPLTAVAGQEAAFEADHLDEARSEGWSVLVTGTAHEVTEEAEVRAWDAAEFSAPWAGGDRPQWIALPAERVTGRRIRVPGASGGGAAPGEPG
ncbi:helix-turn-helix domain-containing protein [Streptomyces physcomitrii]|uniref:Helix-turn-helix domain-containing protein n=1 Tax=Streptomyces physcomitrii TaxID=2724184 RepID=A0ABX1GXV9_9ACTN|nr:pyridoxamine 5'-phosphate oxidase family protein [Streptomyces physcomitrii]NKI40931.1 helix-turn-helix domain-containing protein [Streptomyces physcomitrii]